MSIFEILKAIEPLSRKDKNSILDSLLDSVILHEHYKNIEYKIEPNKQLI